MDREDAYSLFECLICEPESPFIEQPSWIERKPHYDRENSVSVHRGYDFRVVTYAPERRIEGGQAKWLFDLSVKTGIPFYFEPDPVERQYLRVVFK